MPCLLDSKPSVYGNVYLLLFIILVFRSVLQCLRNRCCLAPPHSFDRLALTCILHIFHFHLISFSFAASYTYHHFHFHFILRVLTCHHHEFPTFHHKFPNNFIDNDFYRTVGRVEQKGQNMISKKEVQAGGQKKREYASKKTEPKWYMETQKVQERQNTTIVLPY